MLGLNMKKIKLAVGTASKQKIGYLKDILNKLAIDWDVVATEVVSGVSDQPMTSDETLRGSINRAKEALDKNPEADLSIGIEVGYHPDKSNKYEIFCWATVLDRNGVIISKESHRFLLPKFHQEILNRNLRISDYLSKYFETGEDAVTQYLAEMIRGRKPFIDSAIEQALILYLKKEDF